MPPFGSVTTEAAYEVLWWRTAFGEEEIRAVTEAIRGEHVSQGPVTAQFEAQLADALEVPYAVATTSGSMALLMALMALGIKPGDEVIVPNRTFIATAHAAMLLGAKVVLVDARPDLPTMDVSQLEREVTARTRAIMPVHLNGRAVDMTAVNQVAKEYGLLVVEDAAQALFSRNADGFLGTQSDAGCFSLGVTKLISTGQGGFVVTRSRETYERLLLIRNHGVADTMDAEYTRMGFNFKFNDLLASVGLAQLSRVPRRIAHIKAIYARYAAAIADLPFLNLIPVNLEAGGIPLWVECLCQEREPVMAFLNSRRIQTRKFLPDLHLSPHLQNFGEFPRSKVFCERGFSLPGGPEQPLEHIDRVLEALRNFGESA
ncbi:MAG: pyridoxal phosphate-dependent aminotransferase [Omnitrophica bacterium RIFCSPHIGHO2_02_FULL_63_14]|nr:MAG: pyridoxal phosphate-dependent aminotransferase [Omnitrophica bacterium RIFCSPHIGHO2_02_FULL_63_14]